jgi:hypothetical protein
MPSASKAQQKLFGLVRGVQTGKIPAASVSPMIRDLASKMKKDSVKHYATTKRARLPDKLRDQIEEDYDPVINQLRHAVEHNEPAKIEGTHVDTFTARLLLHVASSLRGDNKEKFLGAPVQKMVAIAYKLAVSKDL